MKSKVFLESRVLLVEGNSGTAQSVLDEGELMLKEVPYHEQAVSCGRTADGNGGCCSGFCVAT